MVRKIVIALVLIAGFFLRFYQVDYSPPGLTMDESSIGYNAYSILQTGKDEYGKPFPIAFRSYADYKMPVYFYLVVPFIKLLGVNILSLRLPSVILGTLAGLFIYLFVLELFGKNRWPLALFSLLIYNFTGWSVLYSRAAFEANAAFFFLVLGIYFQLIALKRNKLLFFVISSLAYSLSIYAYHSEKVLAPLFLLILPFFFKSGKKLNLTKLMITFAIFFLFSSPQYLFLRRAAGNTRIKNTSIVKAEEIREAFHSPGKAFFLVERQLSLYFAYFSPRNLFFDPDPMKTRTIPENSTFYPWLVVPYLLGLYLLFSIKENTIKGSLFFLLIISPLPASITGDPFATLRALPLVFPLSVIIALGLERIYIYHKKIFGSLIFIGFVFSLVLLGRGLFYLLPYEKYFDWNFGYQNLIKETVNYPDTKILFNDPIGDNYAEILFFEKYPVVSFQKEQNKINLPDYYSTSEWVNTFKFGRYEVRQINWRNDVYQNQLIIASPIAISEAQAKEHFFTKAFAIIGPDQKIVFTGYLTNPKLKIEDDERKVKEDASGNF